MNSISEYLNERLDVDGRFDGQVYSVSEEDMFVQVLPSGMFLVDECLAVCEDAERLYPGWTCVTLDPGQPR